MHRTPAGLPFTIPGMDDEMDMYVQQAPQFGLQSLNSNLGTIIFKTKSKFHKNELQIHNGSIISLINFRHH